MRFTLAALLLMVWSGGFAKAETATPLFGGAVAGVFKVARTEAENSPSEIVVHQAADRCTGPDCAAAFKTATLPTSRKKP